jgi:hypothetical protein
MANGSPSPCQLSRMGGDPEVEMANKDKGGRNNKKAPAKDPKQKRQEKKEKKAKDKLRTSGG